MKPQQNSSLCNLFFLLRDNGVRVTIPLLGVRWLVGVMRVKCGGEELRVVVTWEHLHR